MLLSAVLAAALAAQVPARPPMPLPNVNSADAAALAIGWNAIASRQYPAATQAADAVLRRRPWDRGALLLKMHAASGISALRGLDTYEQWLGTARPDDAALLEPVAIAVLRETAAATTDPVMRRDALAALAGSGDENAAKQLAEFPDAPIAADVEAARGGDPAAARRLAQRADPQKNPRNATLARELADAGPAAEPILVSLLQSSDGETRAAAAKSLGTLKRESARPALQRLATDPDPLVRANATVGLAKLNDTAALAVVEGWLTSGVPELQLAAAEAWEGRPGPWVDAVRPLLANGDGLTRIHAARALAEIDPAAARATLAATLADPNPVMRAEAAAGMSSVAAGAAPGDVAALRRCLRETDATVRLAAAKVLLTIAKS